MQRVFQFLRNSVNFLSLSFSILITACRFFVYQFRSINSSASMCRLLARMYSTKPDLLLKYLPCHHEPFYSHTRKMKLMAA